MNKRRYGMQEDNLPTEYAENNYHTTESLGKYASKLEALLLNKDWFKSLCRSVLNVYFAHILFHIEFRSVLGPAIIYFAIVEGFCLLILSLNLLSNIFYHRLAYFTIRKTLDSLAIAIAILILIVELINPNISSNSVYKLGSVYRFILLITIIKIKKSNPARQRRFSVLPFRTNSERLINILRSLRNLEFINSDPLIDSQLEWGIRVICNQTLYNFEVYSENKEQEELIHWALSLRPMADHITFKSDPSSGILDGEIPIEIRQALKGINKLTFNVFDLKKATDGNELVTICSYLMTDYDVFRVEGFNKQKFMSFIKVVQEGYYKNPYHNATHAADVTQAYHVYIGKYKIQKNFSMTTFDIACCLISSAIHDFQHPGLTNAFLMNSSHNLAILYNDTSVLENHHVASSFSILKDKNSNFLENLSSDSYRNYRAKIISLVLATDFSKHFKEISKLKLICKELDVEKSKDFMLKIFMHAADVSNSTRNWDMYYNWAQLVLEEFFSQGDKEKSLGLPVSPLCDRNTVNFAKSQIGFIELFIIPVFSIFVEVFPMFNKALRNAQDNRDKLQTMVEDEDEEKDVQEVLVSK